MYAASVGSEYPSSQEKVTDPSVHLSILIVNWNTQQSLQRCLDSFIHRFPRNDAEVIVVDNASTDESVEVLRSRYKSVIIVENPVNAGFAGGVNNGLKVARGKNLLILNPDVIIAPDVIEQLLSLLESIPGAGGIAPRLCNPDGSWQKGYFRKYPGYGQIFFFHTFLASLAGRFASLVAKYLEEAFDANDEIAEVEQLPGGCMLVNRKALDDVGPMDERFFLFYEDVDWSYRLRRAGWKLLAAVRISVIHEGGKSFKSIRASWFSARFILSLNQFIDKHGSYFLRGWTKLLTLGSSLMTMSVRRIQMFLIVGRVKNNVHQSYEVHQARVRTLLAYFFPRITSTHLQRMISPDM